MKVRISIFIVFLFVFSYRSFSQLDNSSLEFNRTMDTSQQEALFIKIQNLNFLKNNEYSGPIADGFTLFGYQLNAQLGYQFSKNLSLEAGVFAAKDFGNKEFTQILPTFSLRYSKNNFRMIFGNLDGSLNHQLIEPIYNFERVITNRLENGLQFKLNKKYFDFDIWCDWQHMIYRFDSEHEKFVAGINTNLLKLENSKWEFKLPFQGIALHRGGQLDTVNNGTYTNFNYAAGIILNRKTQKKYLDNIYFDLRYVLRSNNYYSGAFSRSSWGDGFFANVGLNTIFKTNILLSYWYADSYYNELGGDLYSSKSRTVAYPNYSERLRELLILRITKKIPLAKNINLTIRVEPNYDLRNSYFEYSYGFYISIDEQFWLKKKVVAVQ